jgi:hypothetical protein
MYRVGGVWFAWMLCYTTGMLEIRDDTHRFRLYNECPSALILAIEKDEAALIGPRSQKLRRLFPQGPKIVTGVNDCHM